MTTNNIFSVITTIQSPTACVRRLCERLNPLHIPLIVMGDKKGPWEYDAPGTELFTLTQQVGLPYSLAQLLPTGHYVRKNLGYLLAISRGAQCIYETDDDNAPNESWQLRDVTTGARQVTTGGWYNVYRLFSDDNIWPRGLPLDKVTSPIPDQQLGAIPQQNIYAPIQQGLANGSPDVDAVWRLVLDREFQFRPGPSVLLPRNTWCPFNSQTTWWWPSAFALMYLPSYCSFRMTDIWRSFIAQRCLWEFAEGVVFHGPEVNQERNLHNLMRDFTDEVPGYLQNARIAGILESLSLKTGPSKVEENLLTCYEALVKTGIFPETELPLVKAWLTDLRKVASQQYDVS
jgi:hypothetical protein